MENRNFLFSDHLLQTEIIVVQHIPLVVQCTYACAWQVRRFSGRRVISDGCAATYAPPTKPCRRRPGSAFHTA